MFRPILLLSTLFALLGMSSACLSEAQWMSIMAPHTGAANAYDKNKFSDAKSAKACDKAMVAFMKSYLVPVSAKNSDAWVQLVTEFLTEVDKNKGGFTKGFKSYVKKCHSKGYDQAIKKLDYSQAEVKAFQACAKNTDLNDWDHTISYYLKLAVKIMNDKSKVVPIMMALMKHPTFAPVAQLVQGSLCASG